MKNIFLLAGLIYCFVLKSSAQNLPAFNITALDTSRSAGVYFLSAFRFGVTSANYPVQLILDKTGRVIYMKRFPSSAGGSDFKLQPNGLISYNASGKYYLMDSLFNIIDSVRCKNGIQTDGHDIQILPNGHYLLMGTETVTMNLSAYNLFNHNGSPGSAAAAVKYGVIQELDANKNVVFEWHSKDYFAFGDVDEAFLNSPSNVDWTHFNAVEMDTDGNILVSVRHFNEITKINRGDSTILWRLGGNQNQFTFINDTAMFRGQHDIRRISNGHITLYDNGELAAPFHPASAKEYQLDETALTATLAWSYTENPNSFSRATGSVQRLPGNLTVVNYGNITNANLVFNTVDSTGNKIFELSFPDTAASYRTFNYPTLPWSLPRPLISCSSVAGQFYLDAGAGYSNYYWSNGATNRSIALTAPDTFFVYVVLPAGGTIRSEDFVVTNISNPCGPVSVPEIEKPVFQIYPNPADDALLVELNAAQKGNNMRLAVSDITGRVVLNTEMSHSSGRLTMDISALSPGIYILRINNEMKIFLKK